MAKAYILLKELNGFLSESFREGRVPGFQGRFFSSNLLKWYSNEHGTILLCRCDKTSRILKARYLAGQRSSGQGVGSVFFYFLFTEVFSPILLFFLLFEKLIEVIRYSLSSSTRLSTPRALLSPSLIWLGRTNIFIVDVSSSSDINFCLPL